MNTNPGRTPQQLAAWNRWHWILAILLIALLLILWATGRGPGGSVAGGCCAVEAPPATPPVAAVATPAPQSDTDNDGMPDATDQCPETPAGHRVGPQGCSCEISLQLQFEADSAALTADDRGRLDEAVQLMERYHFTTGEVAGYASSEGDAAHNMQLSQQRARAALTYLVSKGIANDRLTSTALGESSAIADNITEAGRELNRRVVIRRSDCPAP